VKYKKNVTYSYGFSIIEYDKSENQYRPDIYLIKYNNTYKKPNETLIIKENTEIKIYLNSIYTTLAKFFYDYYDPNVEYISSIDLTHFDSSSLESLESTFYGCISLESIDLSTFTAPSLTNMAQTFFHCSSLKALDLSKLNSSSITNTNRMLCGCESLLYINMSNLDLSKVDDATHMFYNMKEIKYLEIKETKLNEKINEEAKGEYGLNNKDNLAVCKNEENLSIGKHKSICCDYDIELKNCRNYIICKYKETTEYTSGFQNEYRQNIISKMLFAAGSFS
jgi:surface protein